MILWYVFANAIVSGVALLLGVDTTSLQLDHPAPWPSDKLKQHAPRPARTCRSVIHETTTTAWLAVRGGITACLAGTKLTGRIAVAICLYLFVTRGAAHFRRTAYTRRRHNAVE